MHLSKPLFKRSLGIFIGGITLPLFSTMSVSAPLSQLPRPVPHVSTLSIGWVGDMVPSSDVDYNADVFERVSDELSVPDLMIANLEGTFAHEERVSKCNYLATMCHAFRGEANFADEIKDSGIDFVSLVNNHSYDFGEDGLRDTENELNRVGLPYISPTKPTTTIVVKNTRIGIMGLSSTEPLQTINNYSYIATQVKALRENNDIVVVIFHGGAEGSDKTIVPGVNEYMGTENRGNVELVAHLAIDNGADLVLGSGPHVLRKIETYKNKLISYSMGNFVGGNQRLTTTGILGTSGILATHFENKKFTSYDFLSIRLSKNGVPSIDLTDQAKILIQKLSE